MFKPQVMKSFLTPSVKLSKLTAGVMKTNHEIVFTAEEMEAMGADCIPVNLRRLEMRIK